MLKYYFYSPFHSVALNAKAGSSSIAKAILYRFYPEQLRLIKVKNDEYHNICPGGYIPEKPVVLLVRDPLDRFLSACGELRVTQEELSLAIDSLINDTPFIRQKPTNMSEQEWNENQLFKQNSHNEYVKHIESIGLTPPRLDYLPDNVHFYHQHQYAVNQTICFRFPRDIDDAAIFMNLTNGIEHINGRKNDPLQLTDKQKIDIQNYYSIDQQLFDSITEPRFIYSGEAS